MATCDPQELLASAACIDCLSPGLKETLKLQLLCEISQASAGNQAITELTGDVTAGPGPGSVPATIAAGAVTPEKSTGLARASTITAYTTPGTYSIADPGSMCKIVRVTMRSAGGGGGSGRKGAAGSVRGGGASGQGGGLSQWDIPYASITSWPVALTVGAGGAGGASVSSNDTDGNPGVSGGDCSFGSYLVAKGGQRGLGGTNTGASANGATYMFGSGNILGSQQNLASSSTGAAGSSAARASDGSGLTGGSGGGITTGNVFSAGGLGGGSGALQSVGTTGGSTDGASGSNGADNGLFYQGAGGGGGASSVLTNAGSGGNGGNYGAGGGGGGAAVNAVGNSGAGGNGSNGMAIIEIIY